MATRSLRRTIPGPSGPAVAAVIASLARNPLDGYVRLAARYGDTLQVPYSPGRSFFLLSRPEHAEHVLAAHQDNYVKAFTYRPLRALIGNGLLTSEGEDWRRHRRLIQPVFTRQQVAAAGPQMAAATQRMLSRWDSLSEGAVVDVSAEMGTLALDIVGQVLFGADLMGEAEQMRRAMAVGQRAATLATFAPVQWGPASTRVLKGVTRRISRTEGVDGPVNRIIAARRAALARQARLDGATAADGSWSSPRPARRADRWPGEGRLAADRYRDRRRGGHVHAGRPRDHGEHALLVAGAAVGLPGGQGPAGGGSWTARTPQIRRPGT